MHIVRSIAVGTLVLALLVGTTQRDRTRSSPRPLDALLEDEPGRNVDEVFVYDVATRFNERIVSNIDAIDTAVTAVLAGDVAIAVFAIDKIKELHRAEETWVLGMLFGSLIACVLGYAIGSPFGANDRDGIPPRRLIPDLSARAHAALPSAILAVMEAGEINLRVRSWKRVLVLAAMALLVAAGFVVALARLRGAVVQ